MEATKTNKEAVNDSAKISEKLVSGTIESIMDSYNKQLQLSTSIYNNFFNSFLANTKSSNENNNFSDTFLNSELAKLSGISFSDFSTKANPFLTSFDGIYKQMQEYNRTFLESLQNFNSKQIDWKGLNADYTKTIDSQIEASKKIGNSMSETFNKQMDLSIDSNKKLMEEMNNQLNSLIKQNQKFVAEFFKTQQTATNVEDKKSKETSQSETKKKWEVPAIH